MEEQYWSAEVCFEAIRARGARGVALLIGAGCSFTAGIPLARGFVERISQKYPERCADLPDPAANEAYERATTRLSDGEWRQLFGQTVKSAKLNVAHLCIAELISQGVVDRVLTTNFDSLLIQACALWKDLPLIHDCSVADELDDWIDEEGMAIFYLHGQEHGRKMLNPGKLRDLARPPAAEEGPSEDLSRLIKIRSEIVSKVVMGTVRRRPLIVVGYSGVADAVFKPLQRATDLFNPVFWIAFNSTDAVRARSQFNRDSLRHRTFVITRPGDYGADEFFYELLLALDKQSPKLLRRRFSTTTLASARIELPKGDWESWKNNRLRIARGAKPLAPSSRADVLSQIASPQETNAWVESSS